METWLHSIWSSCSYQNQHIPSFSVTTKEFSIIKVFFSSPRSIPLHYFSLFYLNNPSPVSRPQNWIDLRLRSLQFARFGWGFRLNWEIASQTTQTTIWLPLLNVFVTQSEFALLMVNNDFYYRSTQRKIFVWGGRSPEVPFSWNPYRTCFCKLHCLVEGGMSRCVIAFRFYTKLYSWEVVHNVNSSIAFLPESTSITILIFLRS